MGSSVPLEAHCEFLVISVDVAQIKQPLNTKYDMWMASKWVEAKVLSNSVGLQPNPKFLYQVIDKGQFFVSIRDSKPLKVFDLQVFSLSKFEIKKIVRIPWVDQGHNILAPGLSNDLQSQIFLLRMN